LGGVDIVGVDAAASFALAMPVASASFLARCASFVLRLLFGAEVGDGPRGGSARRQLHGEKTGARSIEVGEQCAARIGRDRRNRIARSAETESVQSERCRFFSPRVQRKFLRPRPPPQIS
jgi:hypothetical protein